MAYRTFELDDEGFTIDEYTSTADGARGRPTTALETQKKQILDLSQLPGKAGEPTSTNPALFAQRVLDVVDIADPEVQEIVAVWTAKIRKHAGVSLTPDQLKAVYEASVIAYAALVRFKMKLNAETVRAVPSTDAAADDIMNRFLNPDVPCFFVGCDELRAEMDQQLNPADGADCSACDRGKIMTQFSRRALDAYLQSSPEP